MNTLTIAAALLSCCLLSTVPPAAPVLSDNAFFGQHKLSTPYGFVSIELWPTDAAELSELAIGEQHIRLQGAPLCQAMAFLDRWLAPCSRQPYDFGSADCPFLEWPPDNELPTLLSERVSLYVSCSDCELEDLQMVGLQFLQRSLANESEQAREAILASWGN